MIKLLVTIFLSLFASSCITTELESIPCNEAGFNKYLKTEIIEKDEKCKRDTDCYIIKTIDCCGVSMFSTASKRGYKKERWKFVRAFSLKHEECVGTESCDCAENEGDSYTPNKFPACIDGKCKLLSARCSKPPRIVKRDNLFIYRRTKKNRRQIKKCIRYYD